MSRSATQSERRSARDKHPDRVDISVVCPFFNEEQIIAQAVTGLLRKMAELEPSWELIVVDDGSP